MRDRRPKIHCTSSRLFESGSYLVRCGKILDRRYVTRDPEEVTCWTCKLILDIPEGELDRLE